MKRIILGFAVLSIIALFIAGCGGGGNVKALSGTITDIAANPVPGAEIWLDGRKVTTSLMNGTYKISSLGSGPHNIEAKAMVDGRLWVGTRAVNVFNDGPTMNMNVVIGKWDDLGDLEGTVTDASGNPVPNARVIAVARYPQDVPADQASVISKFAITNNSGAYQILDMPSSISKGDGSTETIIYDVIASSAGLSGQPRGFDNTTKTATLNGGWVTRVDFALLSSSQVVPSVPTGWTSSGAIYVTSFTVPTSITTRSAQSAYDAVKASISEKTQKAIAFKLKTSGRSAPNGALIENDVTWYSIWNGFYGINVPSNLAGFSIYRGNTSALQQTGQYRIDFFRDPAIVSYSDTSRELTPGNTYWYGVAPVSTSYLDQYDKFNPDSEAAMSYTEAVTPLGKLTSVSPANGTQMNANTDEFSWNPLSGARSYRVFIYESYPVIDTTGMDLNDPNRPLHLPYWGQSATSTGWSVIFSDPNFSLTPGNTYWWVVIASNDSDFDYGNAFAISELRSFTAR